VKTTWGEGGGKIANRPGGEKKIFNLMGVGGGGGTVGRGLLAWEKKKGRQMYHLFS